MLAPADIPAASADALVPLLEHLLGVSTPAPAPAHTLAHQCCAAIAELPADSKPTTFDSFVDVARFCVDEEPGWSADDKAALLRSRTRYAGGDESTAARLHELNDEYERRFPTLRFVTYDFDKPPRALADELAATLARESTPDAELERALDMMWDSAIDRATRLEATATAPAAAKTPNRSEPLSDQDEPYLPLSAFRALTMASPVLARFFEHDLVASFRFDQVQRSSTGGAFAWHAAPVSPRGTQSRPEAQTSSPLAALFGNSQLDEHTPASYSRDITSGTRGKVMGFLGGLLGEEGKMRMDALADQVAMRLQTHSVTGPRPSFAQEPPRAPETPKRWPWNSALLRATGGSPSRPEKQPARVRHEPEAAAAGAAAGAAEMEPEPEPAAPRTTLRGSDYAQEGTEAAVKTLRAANEALAQERTTFVIDEVQEASVDEEDAGEPDSLMDDELDELAREQHIDN